MRHLPRLPGPAAISEKGWNDVKLVIAGPRLEVFLNRATGPTLAVPPAPPVAGPGKALGGLRQAAVRGPRAVLTYLSRYTHRVAISNSQLLGFEEAGVRFRYKDYRRNGAYWQQVITLGTDEFIRRLGGGGKVYLHRSKPASTAAERRPRHPNDVRIYGGCVLHFGANQPTGAGLRNTQFGTNAGQDISSYILENIMPSVLMVLTGADTWTMKSGTRHPTGFWAEEFIKPHKAFTAAGLQVHVATPQGRRPTVDQLSLSLQYNDDDGAGVEAQKSYLAEQDVLEHPLELGAVDPDQYDVVFVVGGHGPMQDLAVDPDIGRIMTAVLSSSKKVLAAVCHGPASFLSAFDDDGEWLFKGRTLTGFSNEEETQATFAGNAPWLLEDRLRLAGAHYVSKAPWTPHAVVDGNLVTGQQQVSAQVAAEAVLNYLKVNA